MRILLTTDTIGGVWTFTRELATELLKQGHQVALVSLGRWPSRHQERDCTLLAEKHAQAFRYQACDVPLEWMPDNDFAYLDGAPLLLQVIEEFSPDILHFGQFCLAALPIDIPRLITAHSDVLSWAEACRPAGLEPSAWLQRYVALVQNGLAAADAIAAPTAWMLSALKRHFATPALEAVIANGRSLSATRTPVETRLQAVSAGRFWDEAKNLALLTRVASPIPILIAGEQQQENCCVSAFQGEARVQSLGSLDEDALLDLFRSSSMYLASSIYEPFGLAPLEAALCGCAILANDLPSLREVWGNAALYFNDSWSLQSLLRAVRDDPKKLAQARQAALLRAQRLTAARMADAYLHLYQTLADSPRGLSPYQLTGHAS